MPKKKEERFCSLCNCPNHEDMKKVGGDKNWDCPLLGKKICEVCCLIELAGGLGAPDTFREAAEKTGKSPQEIYATCVGCKHGGKDIGRTNLISVKDGNKQVSEGPVFEAAKKESLEGEERVLKWLRGEFPRSVIRRLNVQRGFKP